MSHGNGGAYSEARVAVKLKNEFINQTCFNPFHRPANHLKVKYDTVQAVWRQLEDCAFHSIAGRTNNYEHGGQN